MVEVLFQTYNFRKVGRNLLCVVNLLNILYIILSYDIVTCSEAYSVKIIYAVTQKLWHFIQ